MKPRPFASGEAFRTWLRENHAVADDIIVLIHKKDAGRGGITYAEALDEALCHGWIDGVRRNFDETAYTIRFSPRRTGSIWSRVNIRHAERLIKEGRMQPAGAKAFAARTARRTGVYSFENRPERFPAALEKRFRAQPAAWAFFECQPPGYKRILTWWVISAKQDVTQQRRLDRLIAESGAGRRVDMVSPFGKANAQSGSRNQSAKRTEA